MTEENFQRLTMDDINSRNLLLKLKRLGPYEGKKFVGKVTKAELKLAIERDRETIETIIEELGPRTVEIFERSDSHYERVRHTDEWKELVEAHEKVENYMKLKDILPSEFANNADFLKEIFGLLDDGYLQKYTDVIMKSDHELFYKQRKSLVQTEEYQYFEFIKKIKAQVNNLREYRIKHPEEIKGSKKNR